MTTSRKPPRKPHHHPRELVSSAREALAAAPKTPPSKSFKIAGIPAVRALFACRPQEAEQLYFTEAAKPALEQACQEMAAQRRAFRVVAEDELSRIAGSPLHGGALAMAKPRPVEVFDHVHAQGWAAAGVPLLVLDGVSNPHNLGAIVRTMAFFGLPHLILSDHPQQAGPSEAAYRVAEGGFEYVTLHRAKFPNGLKRLRDHYRAVATALGQGRAVDGLRSGAKPLALVLGNEEDGLPPATIAGCDDTVTIPGSGQMQSLNVAATAAILVHQLARGRGR